MFGCRGYILLLLVLQDVLSAQTPTFQPIAPSSMTYFSYAPAAASTAPPGSQFLITFPNQATGSELVRKGCTPYSALKYNHYTYDGTWHGPVNGPVYGYFAKFYASTNPIAKSSGLSGNMSFTGSLGSNSDPVGQAFVQSYYWSSDACYEYGPEVGFYRLLYHPGDATEENRVYFYYSMHANCYGDASAGTCRDKVTGASLQPNTSSNPLVIPSTNSQGGRNWVYSAYLTSPTNFHVTVTDPVTGANAITPVNFAVDPTGFFGPTAAQMFSPGLPGYLTVTQQRISPQGGITDSMPNPLKMTIVGLAQVLYLSTVVPPEAFAQTPTYARAYGNCAEGNHTIITAGVNSSPATPVIRSYPSCTVTIYAPGTTTLATIFSDTSGTPKANPFTADTTGRWFFYGRNGSYDVRLSGGGIPTPFTLGDIPLFSLGSYFPHVVLAYAENGAAGLIGAYNPSGTFYSGFTTGNTTANMVWRLPDTDSAGCLSSNGSFVLSFIPCGGGGGGTTVPGGGTQSIQFNNSGAFGGDGNLLWDNLNRTLSVTGVGGTPAIRANGGYILANGGLVSNLGSWQGINSDKDGILVRGVHVAPAAGTTGGYLNLAPLGYGNTPLPLSGLSAFGLHTGLLWVAGTNPMPPDITYGLNTNLYINAAGGLATGNTIFNSIQAPNGGAHARSFTASNYIQSGSSNGPPSPTTNDSFHAGALYFDTVLGTEQVYTGAGWVPLGGGGGGSANPPGGTGTSVQFNAGGGNFGGDTFFFYNTTTHLLTVNALNAASAGIAVGNGYMQSDAGFLATSGVATKYNVFYAPTGGMAASSFTATKYIQAGSNAGPPTETGSDAFHAGAMFWDTVAGSMKVYNGSAWVGLTGAGSTVPGGSPTSVQFNSGGSFGGDTFFFYSTTNQLVTILTKDAISPGLAVGPGYIQGDGGFISGSCNRYNCFQAVNAAGALQGGMAAKSFTATNYVQVGSYAGAVGTGPTITASDAFHAGALSYSTASSCLAVYSGSAWACITSTSGTGTPGGATTNVQYNNAGSFGGSANFIWNNTIPQLTLSGAAGAITDTMNAGGNYVNSLAAGAAGKTIWALGKDGTGMGLLRISDGTGTGGFDNNGAWIYATASDGNLRAQVFRGGSATSTTALTFTNANANFQVNGNGVVSAAGVFNSNGASGGFNVTTSSALNSIQTTGGVNVGAGGSGNGAYQLNGVTIIDKDGNITTTGVVNAGAIYVPNVNSSNVLLGSVGIGKTLGVGGQVTFNAGLGVVGSIFVSDPTSIISVSSTVINSFDTRGGMNAGSAGDAAGGYYVFGNKVINIDRQWVGDAVQAHGLISGPGLSITGFATVTGDLTVTGTGAPGNGGIASQAHIYASGITSTIEVTQNEIAGTIVTKGGVNVASAGATTGGYYVNGNKVVNSTGMWVGGPVQSTGLVSGTSLSISGFSALAGSATVTGELGVTGGINASGIGGTIKVTANEVSNTIETKGGVNVASAGALTGGYYVQGNQVINSNGVYNGPSVNAAGLVTGRGISSVTTAVSVFGGPVTVQDLAINGHIVTSNPSGTTSITGTGCSLVSGSNDIRGGWSCSSGATATLSFAVQYTAAPFCVLNSNVAAISPGSRTTSSIQWAVGGGGPASGTYHCIQ